MYLLPAPKIAGLLPPPRVDMREMIETLLPDDGDFWSIVFDTLDRAEETERLIETYIRRYPHRAPELWDSFMLARRHIVMQDDRLARAHAKELLTRVAHGWDITKPTMVEVAYFTIAMMLHNKELEEPIDPNIAIRALSLQPPHVIGKIIAQMKPVERKQPDPERWYTRVPLHRKLEILGDVTAPPHILADAPEAAPVAA